MVKILIFLLAAGGLGTTGPRTAGLEEDKSREGELVAPISLEGYLWAPVLKPNLSNTLDIKLSYTSHIYYLYNIYSRAHLVQRNITLSGEYTLFDKLTAGVDVPFNFIGVDSLDFDDHSESALGGIRVHVRYPVLRRPELGVILTPAIRVWLPTNTHSPVHESRLESMVMYEPMLLFGFSKDAFSFIAEAGLKVLAFDDRYDYLFASANLVVGFRPFPDIGSVEFIGELNLLAELDDNHAFSKYFSYEFGDPRDRALATALAVGLRYRWDVVSLELALRFGTNDHSLSFGAYGMGVNLGFDFGGVGKP
jgi:hypothetical protein